MNQPTRNIYDTIFDRIFNENLMQLIQDRNSNTETTQLHRTNETFLNNIPTTEINDSTRCSICLEDIEPKTPMHQLPCGHCYCIPRIGACVGIRPWLMDHNTCPMCKYELPEAIETSNTISPDLIDPDADSDLTPITEADIIAGNTYNPCEDFDCAYCVYVEANEIDISRTSQLLGFYHIKCTSAIQLIMNQNLSREQEINMIVSL